jgi:acyl-[acyl carrier protein]--UDP-N-acetylglucosamine O-acyltransferase
VVNAIHQQKQPEKPTINIQALIKQITDTKSLDDLLKAFKDVYPKVQNDAAATKQIMAAKDEMKSLFEGESK